MRHRSMVQAMALASRIVLGYQLALFFAGAYIATPAEFPVHACGICMVIVGFAAMAVGSAAAVAGGSLFLRLIRAIKEA